MVSRIKNNNPFSRPIDGSGSEKESVAKKADLPQQSPIDQLSHEEARIFKGEIVGIEPLREQILRNRISESRLQGDARAAELQAQVGKKSASVCLPEVDDEILPAKQPPLEEDN